ncbi:LPS export ABC transporter periplasmic protein LptC, partial [Thalassospira xiamenensis]
MRRRVWLILILLFGAGAILFWRPFVDSDRTAVPATPATVKPDFTAEGLITKVFEPSGRLAHRINAEKMSHFSQLGLTELTNPVYVVYPEDDTATWEVTADHGSFYDDQTLVLEQNVLIKSQGENDYIEEITTAYLVVNMVSETMTTEQPVTIRGIDFVVRGNGMVADLYAEKLELYRH